MSEHHNPADQAASPGAPAIPRALSVGALQLMAGEGTLSPDAYEAGLRFLGIRPGPRQWLGFWQRMLTSWGALFLAAGVICFFAYNWADMHHFAKFALVGSLILAAGLAAVWRGLDSLPGKSALVLAAICVGPLLAAYGQVYQTGADAWELFRAWTLVILPLALVGRQTGLWLLLWLVGSAWGFLYLSSLSLRGHDFLWGLPGMPEFLLVQTMLLACWEAAAHLWKNKPGQGWLAAIWLPRIVGCATLFVLTCNLARMIVDSPWSRHSYINVHYYLFLPAGYAFAVLYGVLLLGGWLWYRRRRPDLFLISCGVFSLASLLVCLLIKASEPRWEVGLLLIWGIVIAGLTTGCGMVLRRLHHAMEAERAARRASRAAAPGFAAQARPRPTWDGLWEHLRAAHLLEGEPPAIPTKSTTPWYIAVQLAAGGWVAALFLICFLGLFLYEILGVRSGPETPLAIGGLFFLAAAWLLMRSKSIFTEQFALALAIAGIIAVAVAVGLRTWDSGYERLGPLAISLVIAASYPLLPNTAYRRTAALFGLLFFFWGLDFLIWGESYRSWRYRHTVDVREVFQPLYARQALHAIWYGLLSVALAHGWLAERRWRTDARLVNLAAPLLHGIYGALLASVVVSLLSTTSLSGFQVDELQMLEPLRRMVGLGAGIGLLYCAHVITNAFTRDARPRLAVFACTVLALVGGWFLPGLSVGLLGLALARYKGDKVFLGVTVAALIAYFFCYYYNLNTTLLYKSITLMASGAGLWAVGTGLRLAAQPPAAAAKGGDHA